MAAACVRGRGGRSGPAVVKRCLVVHVGPPKGGTTSIQYLLAARARALAARGVHVLAGRRGGGHRGTHNHLAHELGDAPDDRWTPGWARLADEIRRSEAKRFVLSGEAFAGPGRRGPCAAILRELAVRERLEIRVVGYVRPQWQIVESAYAQQVKTGRTALRFEPFAAAMLGPAQRPRLDYNAVFAPFRAAFGAAVSVYPLERVRLPQGLLAHFLAVLGADAAGALAARLPRLNVRPGAQELEVLRRVRAQVGDGPQRGRRGANTLAWLPALIRDDAPFAGFEGANIRRIEDAFADANARFAGTYGIDAGGVLFRAPAPCGPGRRNVARWGDIDAEQRALVQRYVLDRLGVDLDAGRAPAPRWRVRARIAADLVRRPASGRFPWTQLPAHARVFASTRWRSQWVQRRLR